MGGPPIYPGTIAIDDGAGRLKDKINSLIQQGRTSVVLNLADVSYIDSGGLGQLVASTPRLRRCWCLELLQRPRGITTCCQLPRDKGTAAIRSVNWYAF